MNLSTLRRLQNLLLLLVLLVCCCYTALVVGLMPLSAEYTAFILNPNYLAFGAVAICLLSYVVARRFFKRLLGFMLLLAVFHLVNFLPFSVSVGIRLGALPISIDPCYLLLLVGYYLLNRQSANAFLRTHIFPAPTPQQATRLHREAVDQFKQTFARKSDDSLRQMVQDPKLVGNAITAAQELLSERAATHTSANPK